MTPVLRRSKYVLVAAALVVALLLALGVSSMASGHFGLDWLRPGTADTGAQLLTPTPTPVVTTLPTPGTGGTTPPWPSKPQPGSTPKMAQPTKRATLGAAADGDANACSHGHADGRSRR